MTEATFYPYPHCPDCVQFSLEPGGGGASTIRAGQKLTLSGSDEPRSLAVTVFAPEELVLPCLPPEERDAPPLRTVLVGRSAGNRVRTSWPLEGEAGLFRTRLAIDPVEWGHSLEFQALVVRDRESVSESRGFARHRGAALAWSSAAELRFGREEEQREGNHAPHVVWASFSEETEGEPGRNDLVFRMDPATSVPGIQLNSDLPSLVSLMESTGKRGEKARARDAVNALVANQVWSSLLGEILARLGRILEYLGDRGMQEPVEALHLLDAWQREMIGVWAPYLVPDASKGQAESELVTLLANVEGSREVYFRRLPLAIQRFSDTAGKVEALAGEYRDR